MPKPETRARLADEEVRQPSLVSIAPVLIVALVLGLAVRAACIWLAPQTSYLPDHVSNMGWATYAVQHGPLALYDLPRGQPLVVRVRDPRSGKVGESVRQNAHPYNYPPLSAVIFWSSGLAWHALDRNEASIEVSVQIARQMGIRSPVVSRVIDTRASRLAGALPGIVFDLLLAWGVMALVRAVRPAPRSRTAEACAFSLTLLAPPIFLDSSYWTQADAWVMAPLVWCLVCLLRGRCVRAGILYGAAFMIKPQAILLAPVLAYILASSWLARDGSLRRAAGVLVGGAAAALVIALIAAPFMGREASRRDGAGQPWRWFNASYGATVAGDMYQRTTLSAFNVWWLELLAQGPPTRERPAGKLLDDLATLGGMSKQAIGRMLLGGAILLSWLVCARRRRWTRESWLVCAFLITLAAFVLPTRAHERYIYYCIPFALALACVSRWWIPPALAVVVVGGFELVSFRWVSLDDPSARITSGWLAALSVLTLIGSFAVAALARERPALPPSP